MTPLFVGLVKDVATESAARREVNRLGLTEKINQASGKTTFGFIARHWRDNELLNPTVTKRKASTTQYRDKHIVNHYLLQRWEESYAEQIQPTDVEQWLVSLSVDAKGEKGLQWQTLHKLRNLMQQIYAHAQRLRLIDPDLKYNPVRPSALGGARCKSGSEYEAIILTPAQTFTILNSLPLLPQTMVVLDAGTGIRYSEIAGLQWQDVDWESNQIHIHRRWIRGNVSQPKTAKSKAPVPMSPLLAKYLSAWRKETAYAKDTDWVFASAKNRGRTPRVGNMLVRDYLYPAAVKAGVLLSKASSRQAGQGNEITRPLYFDRHGKRVRRFGFHNFRHSLSSFLTTKKKTDPMTTQRMLRQSKAAFTLERYTQTDMDELIAAQELILEAIFQAPNRAVN
jgi:integrase